MLRTILLFFTLITFSAYNQIVVAKPDHEDEGHNEKNLHEGHEGIDEHEEDAEQGRVTPGEYGHNDARNVIHLKPEQMRAANIVVEPLIMEDISRMIRAHGEITLNNYRTIKVTPRISAQVIARHARLGDEVQQGQALVTLSSVEMAEAQGQILLAGKEWGRVKKLGPKVVSERRSVTAKVDYDKAYANAKAYGMSENEIKALFAEKIIADGSFKLIAQQAGRVLYDDFTVGERIEAGRELMVISDESVLWVDARVTPANVGQIDIGNSAELLLENQRVAAKVVQIHHTLDEVTRTVSVRLEVENVDDHLHAGMFVTALIATSHHSQSLQLPEAAVLRSADGDWQVMVEHEQAGEFKAVEVEVKTISDGKAIIQGIKPGTRVVTQGAFFVQSELAKGGFEIHNH